MDFNFNYWKNTVKTTAGGLKYLSDWGVLRYAAAESMLALVYYKNNKDESLKTFAKSQIDYILGKNPANMSYVIGFGSKWPKHPHHRAANGYTNDNEKEAKNLILGALVGGPSSNDTYVDDINQYQYTEVAIDYNAGLVGALAGMVQYNNNVSKKLGDVNSDGNIDINDYVAMQKYVLGKEVNINKINADVNSDGNVNSKDLLILRKYISKQIPSFPVQ